MPAKKATKKTARSMSENHKKALARGREQGRIVREYLAALSAPSKPGRRVSPEEASKRVAQLQQQIETQQDPAKRLDLIQRRIDLEARAAAASEKPDLTDLEKHFAKVAREYGERKGISYSAWREAGVPAAVLKDAGVPRTRRTG
jgi:hypothetical protein